MHLPRPLRIRRRTLALLCVLALVPAGYAVAIRINPDPRHSIGAVVDSLNGVEVHYNGGIAHTSGRHLAPDGYNLGLKYQCVEFVKRYYWQRFGHEMPEARGNAKDFFDPAVADGALNAQRGLLQFRNGSTSTPQPDDILVLGPALLNPWGHVAIVSEVRGDALEVVQQNPGPFVSSRRRFALRHDAHGWTVDNARVLGWLRLPATPHVAKPGTAHAVASGSLP